MNEKLTPAEFLALCKKNGITIERTSPVLSLFKKFTPGNCAEYADAESDVSILYSVPCTSGGSIWGTDGGSIGGAIGMKDGYMRLNRSGVSKKFLKELAKLDK